MRKKYAFNPLRNPGTSEVFFAIATGAPADVISKIVAEAPPRKVRRTPSQVSKTVGVKPPGVLEQISRLEKFGIVEKGEKKGRSQFYDIAWDRVIELFVDRVLSTVPKRWVPKTKKWVPLPGVRKIKKSREKMLDNSYFGNLVLIYLSVLADDAISMEITIEDVMGYFAEDIVWIYPHLRRKPKDREMREFLSELRKWYEWRGSLEIPSMDSLMDACKILELM